MGIGVPDIPSSRSDRMCFLPDKFREFAKQQTVCLVVLSATDKSSFK